MKISRQFEELPAVFGIKDNGKFLAAAEKTAQSKLEELFLIPQHTKEISVSLTFLDSSAMQETNMRYREIDAPTDVLSFPMWEDENGYYTPPEGWGELPLGDIVICPEVVVKNAQDNKKHPYEEFALVFFHSVLHLTGYDHDTEERKKEMWALQDELVASLVKELNNE